MPQFIYDILDMAFTLFAAAILLGSYYFQGHEKNKLYKKKWALAGGCFMVFYFFFLVVDKYFMN